MENIKRRRIDLLGFIKKKVGNDENTFFWKDVWIGDVSFKSLYPRVYALETSKNITLTHKLAHDNVGVSLRRWPRGGAEFEQLTSLTESVEGYMLYEIQDRWVWSLMGSGEFSVASVRRHIGDHMLPNVSSKTRWLRAVLIKVNFHAWKVKFDNLPTRFNFSRRGLDIPLISCPICGKAAETTSNIFFSCHMIRDIYSKISTWWDFHLLEVSSFEEWRVCLSYIHLHGLRKEVLEEVFYIIWSLVWNFRNKLLFGKSIPIKVTLFDDVVARSFS